MKTRLRLGVSALLAAFGQDACMADSVAPPATRAAERVAEVQVVPGHGARPRVRRAKTPEAQRIAGPELNGVAQAAGKVGVRDCLQRMDQVTDFLTQNTRSGAFLFVAPTDTNAHIASVSLEIEAGNSTAYASSSFAPTGAAGCGTLYETVSYWDMACRDVAAKVFAQFKSAGALQRTITMLEGGPSLRVFLMPAGQGCISVKKEVLF